MIYLRTSVFILVAFAFLAATGCVAPIAFQGSSMLPTFHDGDRLLLSKNVSDLQRFDIIHFKFPLDEDKTYIKRIVGLPGERVEIVAGVLKIDGAEIKQPFLDETYDRSTLTYQEFKVPADSYFVLGDNRDNSSDSRYWGPVKKSLILSKYYSTYYKAGTH